MKTFQKPDRTGSDKPASVTQETWRRRVRRTAIGTLLGVVYWTAIRPRMLNWGATPAEVDASLPGDDLLPDPDAESTMAISIDAPPGAIWPWLRQIGQERGGFYSYEWAENLVGLDIHNADHIVTDWQDLAVGDSVRLGRADRYPDATLEVVGLDPERSLILRTPDEPTWWVWSFVLDPVDELTTRLLVRSRIRLPESTMVRVATQSVLDPVTFVMTRGMLQGIRSRAERLPASRTPPGASNRDFSR